VSRRPGTVWLVEGRGSRVEGVGMAEGAQPPPGAELVPGGDQATVARAEGALSGPVVRLVPVASGGFDLRGYLEAHSPVRAEGAAYLRVLAADVAGYARAAHAEATRGKYEAGWADFVAFCGRYGLSAGVPERVADVEVVALYLADLARGGVSMSTLDGRIAAIRACHLRFRPERR
jgi:hypothetical protein